MPATKSQTRFEKERAIHRGLALQDALRLAERLGVTCTQPRRTGEIRFELPGHRSVVVNSRRKDLPRATLVLLKRAAERR